MTQQIINFNDEQNIFLEDMRHIIHNREYGLYLLKARAGTGKTTMINHMKHNFPVGHFQVIAPTHKACSLFIPNAKTIHSYYHITPDINTNTGIKEFFSFTKCAVCGKDYDPDFEDVSKEDMINHIRDECDFPSYITTPREEAPTVLLIDECSMISYEMLNIILYTATKTIVVLFGDDAQIPPVKYPISPVFAYKHITKEWTLSTNMRANDDTVRLYCEAFRSAIYQKHFINVPKVDKNKMFECFQSDRNTIVLSWTNRAKNALNDSIRRHLYASRSNCLNEYYLDETLIFSGYKNIHKEIALYHYIKYDTDHYLYNFTPLTYDEYSKSIIIDFLNRGVLRDSPAYNNIYHTNDMIVISALRTVEYQIPYYKCEHQKIKNTKCDECKLKKKRKQHEIIKFHQITNTQGDVFYKPLKEDMYLIKGILDYYKDYIKSRRSKQLWRSYYLLQELLKCELDYSYSLTVHKSQGSQWRNVFVNIDNIRRCWDDKYKLAYTAVSRAQENVYFLKNEY